MFEKERLVEQKIQTVNEDDQRYLKIPLCLQQHILDSLQVNNTWVNPLNHQTPMKYSIV